VNSSLFSGYFDGYVSQVWQKYQPATLTVDTQASTGGADQSGAVSSGSPAQLTVTLGAVH
jgi:hypothetical protein